MKRLGVVGSLRQSHLRYNELVNDHAEAAYAILSPDRGASEWSKHADCRFQYGDCDQHYFDGVFSLLKFGEKVNA
jgi:hypothetical protein